LPVPEVLTRATGRRKESVCRARFVPGSGQWDINGRPFEDYFPSPTHRMIITEPLRITNTEGRYDIVAKVEGGGTSGQAGALRHAIARALADLDPELRGMLKKAGFLTRDAREKERRKYGLKKARKAPQYSKR
jgi:small subunit ribosomal protein S9